CFQAEDGIRDRNVTGVQTCALPIWREVTNLPSRPAKGESLTEKVISMVGAEIFTNSMGSMASGAQMVSPMVISPMPLMAMMLPEVGRASCRETARAAAAALAIDRTR